VTAQGGGQWVNEEFNDLFARQLREMDYEERYKQVARLQEIIAEELPTLTLYYRKITFAYNPEALNGWFFTKDGVARAVPTVQNKLVYIRGTWGR
jgi:peptide/nickel transport system substrate-binding protein